MSHPDQVLHFYCESCRARRALPEAIGAPFGGMVTANCEFCLRERECHAVAEHDVQLRSAAEDLPASLTLNREIPADRENIAGRALDLRVNLLRLGLAKK